jgi:hypothetical protein
LLLEILTDAGIGTMMVASNNQSAEIYEI